MEGREEDIRPCIRCNGCLGRTMITYWSITCDVNPGIGREDMIATPEECCKEDLKHIETMKREIREFKDKAWEMSDEFGDLADEFLEFGFELEELRQSVNWTEDTLLNNEEVVKR